MTYLVFLAGGTGSRMKKSTKPKQYLLVNGKPIFLYSLMTFEESSEIDGIVIVAHQEWQKEIQKWMRQFELKKFIGFAAPGTSRQGSIYNALKFLKKVEDQDAKVIIHDAARPLVSPGLIHECLSPLTEYEGVMPVLQAKDTFYQSKDGKHILNLLPRAELVAGQAPESFRFQPYLHLHENLEREQIDAMTGSTEIAFKNKLKVLIIPGEERNFKITTDNDLELFRMLMQEENE